MFVPLTILFAFIALVWYRLRGRPNQWAKQLVAQGASDVPIKKDPSDILYGWKKLTQDHPDVKAIVYRLPGRVGLFAIDPDLIKEVLTNHKCYSKMNRENELSMLFSKNGISRVEGDQWKLHRRIISEVFQYDLFDRMVPVIRDGALEILNLDGKQAKKVSLPNDIEFVTSDIITRIFFGIRSKDVPVNGKSASEEASEILRINNSFSKIQLVLGNGPMNLLPKYRKQKQRIENFRNAFREKIHERMQQIQAQGPTSQGQKKSDLLELLLEHRIKYKNDFTQTFTDEEILDEFAIFFMAGKDTTSLLISMTLYCCVTYPEWGDKFIKEIRETVHDLKDLNVDLLNSMNFVTAFLNEVLRMYPPAPALLMRTANCDHHIGKMFVKKGYLINAFFMCNNYNPKYFKDPNTFDPARWTKTEDKDEGIKNPFAYLPFSAGQRNCVGKHLALIEAKTILCTILTKYNVNIEPGYELKLGTQTLGYSPVDPIPLNLTPL